MYLHGHMISVGPREDNNKLPKLLAVAKTGGRRLHSTVDATGAPPSRSDCSHVHIYECQLTPAKAQGITVRMREGGCMWRLNLFSREDARSRRFATRRDHENAIAAGRGPAARTFDF